MSECFINIPVRTFVDNFEKTLATVLRTSPVSHTHGSFSDIIAVLNVHEVLFRILVNKNANCFAKFRV